MGNRTPLKRPQKARGASFMANKGSGIPPHPKTPNIRFSVSRSYQWLTDDGLYFQYDPDHDALRVSLGVNWEITIPIRKLTILIKSLVEIEKRIKQLRRNMR